MKISIKREQNNARIGSAEREKVRTKFKKTMRFLSMAALALMGAMMTGCSSSDDSIADIPQQPGSTSKTVTLTTTVGLDGATTRALDAEGKKTFAKDETMAIIYKKKSGETVKAVSEALKDDGDIAEGAKSATFTFELEDPDTSEDVTYIYPAAMANSDGSINYAALATQDGTLATLSSSLDLATKTAAWEGTSLPAATLENQLAILACTIKKHAGDDITSSITSMTVSDGSNTYAVSRSAAAGPIYVAICPTTNATINVTATNATRTYYKTLATTKTYAASNGYSVSWKMDPPVLDLADCEETSYTVTEDMVITGTPKSSLAYLDIFTDGNPHEITLDNVNPNGEKNVDLVSPYSTMTIKLKGENRLVKIRCNPQVTIDDAGDGTLIVISEDSAIDLNPEGEGGNEGTLIINGGTVKAKATLAGFVVEGNLTVNGGAVYIKGVYYGVLNRGYPAIQYNLTVNGGAVYIAGGDGAQAVQIGIGGDATLYGWDEYYGWISKNEWAEQNLGDFNSSQYITTDENSGYPTDPGNSKWNW